MHALLLPSAQCGPQFVATVSFKKAIGGVPFGCNPQCLREGRLNHLLLSGLPYSEYGS